MSVATRVLICALAKRREHALALALRLVAVDRFGGDAGAYQPAHDLVGAMLGPGEDQRAVDRLVAEHVDEDAGLRRTVDTDQALVDAFRRRRHRRDRDLDRIAQHLRREIGDGARHRRREHQRLPVGRKLGDDLSDVVNEAHVEHAVGFIEHETLDLAETKRIALNEIEQPAGRSDQNVDAVEQRADLLSHRHTADRERRAEPEMAAISAEAVEDLTGQFARRAQHQDAAALAHARPWIGGELMQDRQRKGRGLAGAGLGDSDNIATRHDGRNSLRLDRGRREVFFFGKGTRDRVM